MCAPDAMNRIAILVPYFGAWPAWLDLYLRSCRANPFVDWHFVTDCDRARLEGPNVIGHASTLPEVEARASERLGMPIHLARPYKLCDLRPAFGHIFEDRIRGYDFWGWGDLDVLYGRLDRLLHPRALRRYDVLSPKLQFTAGAFSVFRNTPEIARLYRRSRDHVQVFQGDVGYDFDEIGKFKDRQVDSITHVVRRSGVRSRFCTEMVTDRMLDDDFELHWVDGDLYDARSGRPYALYHFIDRKRKADFRASMEAVETDRFRIRASGFADATGLRRPSNPMPRFLAESRDRLRSLKFRLTRSHSGGEGTV